MNETSNKALLPAGLRDILPPDAAFEANAVERLMTHFASFGYDRVKPPLIEFEETLLAGPGAATAGQTFRIMDPVSQQMMGVRADITPQIARIATTRLVGAARPLRLSYAGQVLRVKGTQLRPERQFAQAGIEVIGAEGPAADAEVVVLAAEALERLGIGEVSVDLTSPTLVPELLAALGAPLTPAMRDALDHKDAAAVRQAGGKAASVLLGLINAVGPADRALAALAALDLPAAAAAARAHLDETVALVRAAAPGLRLTVDPVENRGFEYHSGVSFAIFARGVGGELGRGGRYSAGGVEPATGATLFMDTVLGAMPGAEPPPRVFLPHGTSPSEARRLREQGWMAVAGLDEVADARAEAARLGCGNVLEAGQVVELE